MGKNKKTNYDDLILKYGKEKVLELLEAVEEEKKEVFKDYYGIEREEVKIKDLVDKYKVASNTIYQRIDLVTKKIEDMMDNPIKYASKKEKFEFLFKEYDLEEVYGLIEKLDDKERDYIKCYYELGENYLTVNEFFAKYNVSSMNCVSIYNLISKLKKVLDNPSIGVSKIDSFYKSFPGYNKNEVDKAVDLLNEKDKELIKNFFGLGVDSVHVLEIARREGITRQGCFLRKDSVIKKIHAILTEIYSDSSEINAFYSLFKGVSKRKIDAAFNWLNEEERHILSLIYGINCPKVAKNQVSKKYNLEYYSLNLRLKEIVEKMNNYIINPDFMLLERKAKFYSNFEGYSQEEVHEALEFMREKDYIILKEYFGLEGEFMSLEEISETYLLEIDKVKKNINESIKLLKKILKKINSKCEEDNRRLKLEQLVCKYGGRAVNHSMKKLNEEEIEFVVLYYGLKNIRRRDLSEISSITGIPEDEVFAVENGIINKLEKIINEECEENKSVESKKNKK